MSTTFEARYYSRCAACDEPIQPGDAATWADGDVVHAACKDHSPSAPRPVCDRCWMEQSLSGDCECDE